MFVCGLSLMNIDIALFVDIGKEYLPIFND